jgi:hypothetical protein
LRCRRCSEYGNQTENWTVAPPRSGILGSNLISILVNVVVNVKALTRVREAAE